MKKSTTKKFISAVSAAITFIMVLGLFAVYPGTPSPILRASAENIFSETPPTVTFDADYMKNGENGDRLSGNNQCDYSFRKDSDGRTVLRLVTKPTYDKETGALNPEDPYVSFDIGGSYSADEYKYVTILTKIDSEYWMQWIQNDEVAATSFRMFYKIDASGKSNYVGTQSKAFKYNDTDEWQLVTFDMSSISLWSGGNILGIRFDFYEGSSNNAARKNCEIGAVILSKTPEDVYNVSFELMQQIYPPVQTLSDFTKSDLPYFEKAEGNDPKGKPWPASLDNVLTEKNGNLLYTFKYDYSVDMSLHSNGNPYAGFFYDDFAESRGITPLTTADFNYTVFRFRTKGNIGGSNINLWHYTGDKLREPTFIDGASMSSSNSYTPSTANQWRCIAIPMATSKTAVNWKGDFNGFRIDWCVPGAIDAQASMEISEIMFFKDEVSAKGFSEALDQINVAIEEEDGVSNNENFENSIKVPDDSIIMLPDELDTVVYDSDSISHGVSESDGVKVVRLETLKELSDPFVTLKPLGISADEYKFVTLAVRSNVMSEAALKLDFVTDKTDKDDKASYVARYKATNDWQLITLPLGENLAWSGEIEELKLNYFAYDPIYTGYAEGTVYEIAGIAFSKDIESYYDSAYYLMAEAYRPTQILSGFDNSDLAAFTKSDSDKTLTSVTGNNTMLTVKGDDLRLDAAGEYKDPSISFYYHQLMKIRGVAEEDRVTTADFNTTVIRYRTSPKINGNNMQLFLFTGTHNGPFVVEGTDKNLSANSNYPVTAFNTWRSLCIQMNGIPDTASAWSGAFNGFRIDWASPPDETINAPRDYIDISEFFFFDSVYTANKFAEMVNSLYYPNPSEVSDEFSAELSVPEGVYTVGPDGLLADAVDSKNSVCYPVSVNGVSAVRLESVADSTAPYITYSPNNVSADEYKYVTLLIRRTNADDNMLLLYYATDESPDINKQYVSTKYSTNSKISKEWQTVTFNLSGRESFKGTIEELKLCYQYSSVGVEEGTYCDIAGIAFSKTEEQVYDAAEHLLLGVYSHVQVLGDFTDADAEALGGAELSGGTSLTFENGNVVYSAAAAAGDPQKFFDYLKYAQNNKIKPVTTDVFRYTVIRYKSQGISAGNRQLELFILTGDANSLMDMVRNGGYGCHSGVANYLTTGAWKSVVVDMAEDDGLADNTKLKYGWNREDGNTTFKGFRFDWAMNAEENSSFTVSDIIFFDSLDTANAFSAATNSVVVPAATGDNVDPGFGDDWIDEESSTEEDGNESIPEFPNPPPEDTSEESGSDETESDTETDAIESNESDTTEEIESDTTEEPETKDTESELPDETESEEDDESEGEGEGNKPGIITPDDGESDQTPGEGSQAPFYIVCGCLGTLTVASLVSVGVIKRKIRLGELGGTDPSGTDPDGTGTDGASPKEKEQN